MKISNGKIRDVSISMADHGVIYFRIFIDTASGFFCYGDRVGGHGYLGSDYWTGNGSMVVAMMKIMDTVGVERWEDLKGKYIRFEDDDWGSKVTKIGHIMQDKWFDIEKFFSNVTESTTYILDEREPKRKEDDDKDDNS